MTMVSSGMRFDFPTTMHPQRAFQQSDLLLRFISSHHQQLPLTLLNAARGKGMVSHISRVEGPRRSEEIGVLLVGYALDICSSLVVSLPISFSSWLSSSLERHSTGCSLHATTS